jgi:hypothetical protein
MRVWSLWLLFLWINHVSSYIPNHFLGKWKPEKIPVCLEMNPNKFTAVTVDSYGSMEIKSIKSKNSKIEIQLSNLKIEKYPPMTPKISLGIFTIQQFGIMVLISSLNSTSIMIEFQTGPYSGKVPLNRLE